MAFLVSTSGTTSLVVLNDLAGRSFTHPTIDFDLALTNSSAEIASSIHLQDAITSGTVTVKDGDGNPISNASDILIPARIQKEYTITPGATQSITHTADSGGSKPCRQVEVLRKMVKVGTNLAPSMTPYDPEKYSSNEVNINDKNILNFWYNNKKKNPAEKWIGLDNGSAINITHAKWYDYSTNAYQPTRYRIEGSNNGSSWTTLADISDPLHMGSSTEGHLVDLGGTQNYRYYRWYCVSGVHKDYVIISEFELYNVTDNPCWCKAKESDALVELVSATETRIVSQLGQDSEFLINIRF